MSEFAFRRYASAVQRLGVGDEDAWDDIAALQIEFSEEDIELFVAVDDRELNALREIVDGWLTGKRSLPLHDRNLLKRALKAFRKRLRVVRLDAESSVGGGPMSSGKESSIVGVRAPDQFSEEVWDELVRQGRLLEGRDGTHELPPE